MKQIVIAAATILALASTAALAEKRVDKADKQAVQAQSTEVRDWSKIDTNKDNLVSPEEMEKFLASTWQSKKTASK
jgi:hypothetical protein